MANTNAYIDRIQVPNGSNTITNYLVDNVSGYGKKTLVIHLTSGGDGSFQSDVSYNEISAAYEDGRDLIVSDESELLQESVTIFAPLTSYVDYTFYFERLASRNSTSNTSGIGSYYRYSIDPGNAPSTSASIAGNEIRGVPFASSSNNGKVLKVVNGNWEPANESASSTFTVHLTYSGGSEGTWTADKTWAEIEAAYDPENCCICAEYTENSVVNTLPLTSMDSEGSFIFGQLKTENHGGYDQFIINTNDQIIYEYYQFQLPSTATIRRWS